MKSRKIQVAVIVGLLIVTALMRLLPVAPNFSPIIAIALFGAAIFNNKNLALLLPLSVLLFSDIVLELAYQLGLRSFSGLHSEMIYVYGAFFLIAVLSYIGFKKLNLVKLGVGAFFASVLFFLISNFGVWLSGGMYTMDLTGLLACYTAAIPFFHNTLLSTIFYSGVLFGSYYLLNKQTLKLVPVRS